MTRLDKPLRREIEIAGDAHTLTIDAAGLKLVRKGRRNGVALRWSDLTNGDAALASALRASVQSGNAAD